MGKAVTETAARKAALGGKAIEIQGLKFRGIPMGRYEEWAGCKNVWLARQSTFPVFCITLPFLDALWALDMNAIEQVGKPAGLIYRIMYGIGLAMGLNDDCVRDGHIGVKIDEQEKRLTAITVQSESGKTIEITASTFNTIRKVVAWMQGDEAPDESLNDELLETERELAGRNAPNLHYDMMDLAASVALNCGKRIKDIMEWPILEFEFMRRAVDRSKKNLICSIGETNGCKWDSGNPYPSWCFDKEKTGSDALISAAKFAQTKTNKKE